MSLAEGPRGRPYPKLPFWNTVGLSYSTYFRNFIGALQASWLWLIVVAALTAAGSWLQWSWITDMAASAQAGLKPQLATPTGQIILVVLSKIAPLPAGVSIAVAWHRLMILGEPPGLSGANIASRNFWDYIVTWIVLALTIILPAAVVLFPILWVVSATIHGKSALFLALPIVVAAYAAALFVWMRLILLLPAHAIGNNGLTFAQAWNRTRGNVWRLLGGIIATTLPPILIIQVAFMVRFGFARSALQNGSELTAEMTALTTVVTVYYMLVIPISVGFISHAYRHFIEAPLERV
jgi:hypothetical protein